MDLTIPYTFYPSALPHGIAWGLFIVTILGSVLVTFALSQRRSRLFAASLLIGSFLAFLLTSIVISMVIMFFIHDI